VGESWGDEVSGWCSGGRKLCLCRARVRGGSLYEAINRKRGDPVRTLINYTLSYGFSGVGNCHRALAMRRLSCARVGVVPRTEVCLTSTFIRYSWREKRNRKLETIFIFDSKEFFAHPLALHQLRLPPALPLATACKTRPRVAASRGGQPPFRPGHKKKNYMQEAPRLLPAMATGRSSKQRYSVRNMNRRKSGVWSAPSPGQTGFSTTPFRPMLGLFRKC